MKRKRILVVDDDERIVRFVVRVLEEAGFEAHATTDPRLAVRLAGEVKPALVIVDLNMPGRDGFTVAEELHALKKGLRVMFLTGRPVAENIESAKEVGALGYLQKPFKAEDLLAMARRLLPAVPGKC